MSGENDLFNNSELALAAYADLSLGKTSDQIDSLKQDGDGMSQKEAEEFAKRYKDVIAVIPDQTSGFSATIFKTASKRGQRQLRIINT
jgi:hypothetical protein